MTRCPAKDSQKEALTCDCPQPRTGDGNNAGMLVLASPNASIRLTFEQELAVVLAGSPTIRSVRFATLAGFTERSLTV